MCSIQYAVRNRALSSKREIDNNTIRFDEYYTTLLFFDLVTQVKHAFNCPLKFSILVPRFPSFPYFMWYYRVND